MTTKLHKETALPAIQKIAKITETKNTIPILANVALSVSDDTLTMTGTDLDIEVTVTVPCASDTDMKCTVNATDLAKIFGRAKDEINLTLEDHVLRVSFGRTKVDFSTLDFEDFPVLASSEYENTFDMGGIEFADMLSRTIVAASTEELRYFLNGVYWHTVDGKLKTASTNGQIAAVMSSDIEADIAGVIIPTKTVKVLSGIDAETITASVSETKVRFEYGDTCIVSKVIDGTFPDYSRVIPSGNPHALTMNGKDLKDAISTASIIADGKTRGIKFSVESGNVVISARGDKGLSTVDVPCTFTGEPMDIGFNSAYVIAIAGQVGDGDVVFELGGSGDPARVVGTGDDGFEGVIMPMRI